MHLEAIDFIDEEGTLVGLFGSVAVAGLLHEEALRDPRGAGSRFDRGRFAGCPTGPGIAGWLSGTPHQTGKSVGRLAPTLESSPASRASIRIA